MLAFILVFLFYSLQGAVNGAGYSKKKKGQVLVAVLQGLLTIPLMFGAAQASHTVGGSIIIISGIVSAIVLFCIVMNVLSFKGDSIVNDIHLWTALGTYLFLMPNLILNPICVLAVYPGLILQKGLINIGLDLPFFSMITDDKTGATFGIPSLGIKIPRASLKVRLVVASVSLVGYVVLYAINLENTFKFVFYKIWA